MTQATVNPKNLCVFLFIWLLQHHHITQWFSSSPELNLIYKVKYIRSMVCCNYINLRANVAELNNLEKKNQSFHKGDISVRYRK